MNNLKEIWPLFVIVAILGGLVSFNVLGSRPSIEQAAQIIQDQKDRRDAFLPAFEAMSFQGEVVENKTFVRKYPFQDVRYFLKLKEGATFQYPDSLGKTSPVFDLSNPSEPTIIVSHSAKGISQGSMLSKSANTDYVLATSPSGAVDTISLEFGIFVDESLYTK